MRVARLTYILGLLLLVSCYTFGQQVGFDNITIDNGLMHNNVNAIVQDRHGFMWFGTRDGLCRYDGYDFRLYAISDSAGSPLTDQRIQKLFIDHDDNIWVMPTQGGMLLFDMQTQKFVAHPINPDISWWNQTVIQSALKDSRGNYWIGTTEFGVVEVDSTFKLLNVFTPSSSEPDRQITGEHCYSFTEDQDGRIWFGLSGSSVNRYDPATDSLAVITEPDVTDVEAYSYRRSLASAGRYVWIGTEGKGVLTFDTEEDRFVKKMLESVLVRDLGIGPAGNLLVATDGAGLYRISTDDWAVENFGFDPSQVKSLSTNALYEVYVDRNDNIWIGSYNGGVNLLPKQQARFATFSLASATEQGTGANSVIAFAPTGRNEIWAGLDGSGLLKLSIDNETLTPIESMYPGIEISSDVITSLFLDEQKNVLWAGTFLNGLNRIDLNAGKATIFRAGEPSAVELQNNNIWDILIDDDGLVWLATLGGGLHGYDQQTGVFRQYLPEAFGSGLSDRNVRTLFLDSKQNLWIGTERGGLNKLLPDRKTFISWESNFEDEKAIHSNFVVTIHEDSKGRIWIGTEGGGLHRMLADETGFDHFGTDNGLSSNIIYSIEEDNSGKFWLGTSKGLDFFDPSTGNVIRFDQRDGLLSNQFNPNASAILPDGQLLFGNIKGINAVDPNLVNIDATYPDVVFTDFKVFDKSIPVGLHDDRQIMNAALNEGPEVTLKHLDNAFTISFAAIAYASQKKVQYAYRLRGFNDNWTNTDISSRDATYTNLDAGTYTFEVKASNVFGEWPESFSSLEITIQPPFWNTLWFKSLVGLVIIGIMLLILRYIDIRRREEHERRLEQAQQEILRLKNEQLEQEVQSKNSRLSAALLQSAHKNKALANLGEQLKELSVVETRRPAKELDLRKLVRKISTEVDSVDYWEQFQLNFDAVHQDFSHKLYTRHPNLTQNDVRLCSLIRINMTNSEIGSIQSISKSGVEKSKYRLKQKLGLSSEDDLNTYIQTLD